MFDVRGERGSNKLLAMTLMRNLPSYLFICLLRTAFGADVLDEGGFAQVSCLVMRGDQQS